MHFIISQWRYPVVEADEDDANQKISLHYNNILFIDSKANWLYITLHNNIM